VIAIAACDIQLCLNEATCPINLRLSSILTTEASVSIDSDIAG
jgi:hypothetical protein